jgi:hypothetical protein
LGAVSLREDTPLRESPNPTGVSEETMAFMGVRPMRIYSATVDSGEFPEQRQILDNIIPVSEGAEVVVEKEDANILLLPGSAERKFRGMWNFRREYQNGVAGIAVSPPRREDRGEVTTDDIWTTLGYSFAAYSIHPISDRQGRMLALVEGSMEGAYDRTDVTNGYREAADRIRFIGASEKITKNTNDGSITMDEWINSVESQEVIKTCQLMRKWKVMPHLDLRDYVPDEQREKEVMILIGTTGLSTGNASVWEQARRGMRITASGVDKGNLKPNQVLPVSAFTEEFNGVVIDTPEGIKPPKASVEAFDNLLNYYISLGIQSGDIKTNDIREIIAFARDSQRVSAALEHHQPTHIRQIHFHAHPDVSWDSDKVTVVEANPNLVPYGDANSSCGTRPLAYYTAEMIARGILHTKGDPRIVIAKLPKHGSQIFSPFDYETTMHYINPRRPLPTVIFAPVDMNASRRSTS